MRMTRLVPPRTLRDGGHIVNIGSVAGRRAYPNGATYVTSKFAVRGFTLRAARGPARPADPRHDRRRRPRRDGVLDRALPRRRGAGRSPSTRDVAPLTRRRHRRLHPLRGHAAAARERRRDRRDGDRTSRAAPRIHRIPESPMLTILEGSTFCICDERGDLAARRAGSSRRTRASSRASRSRSTASGRCCSRPGKVEYFSAAFYLRNPLAGGLPAGRALDHARALRRRRRCRSGSSIQNQSMEPLRFEVGLEPGCDFADIFAVKQYDFALGDPEHAKPLPPLAPADSAATDELAPRSTRDGDATHAGALLAPGRARTAATRRAGTSSSAAARPLGGRVDVVSLDGKRAAAHRRRRFGEELAASATRWRRGSCACRSCTRAGTTSSTRSAVGQRPRRAAHARGRRRQAACPPPACRGS